MAWFTTMLTSTIGKKLVMSLTGLFLCLFLVIHLTINSLALVPDGGLLFNEWAHFMGSNFFIRAMEIVLFAGIILHVIQSVVITIDNKKARPQGYAVNNPPSHRSPWYTRSMGILGSLILFFLIVHLRKFWFQSRFIGYPPDANGNPNQYADFFVVFANPWYVALYIVGVLALGYHLLHGFQSAWRTLGIMHNKWTPVIRGFGVLYTVILCIGFAIIPIYFYLTQHS